MSFNLSKRSLDKMNGVGTPEDLIKYTDRVFDYENK